MSGGSQLPRTAVAPALDQPGPARRGLPRLPARRSRPAPAPATSRTRRRARRSCRRAPPRRRAAAVRRLRRRPARPALRVRGRVRRRRPPGRRVLPVLRRAATCRRSWSRSSGPEGAAAAGSARSARSAPAPPGSTPPLRVGGVHHAATMLAGPEPDRSVPVRPVRSLPVRPVLRVRPGPRRAGASRSARCRPVRLRPPSGWRRAPRRDDARRSRRRRARGAPQPPGAARCASRPAARCRTGMRRSRRTAVSRPRTAIRSSRPVSRPSAPATRPCCATARPTAPRQQLIRRSAPGTPHPEWQILHELRAMNVPPQQVLELHTELESCELPGGYCARMIRETWPQVRITSVAPYGRDHASRQQGMQHLLDPPGRVAPGRGRSGAPRAGACAAAAGAAGAADPAGGRSRRSWRRRSGRRASAGSTSGRCRVRVCRRSWRTRWCGRGCRRDFGPFFWAQPAPGRSVPTLAELAAQRQVQPAAGRGFVSGDGQRLRPGDLRAVRHGAHRGRAGGGGPGRCSRCRRSS